MHDMCIPVDSSGYRKQILRIDGIYRQRMDCLCSSHEGYILQVEVEDDEKGNLLCCRARDLYLKRLVPPYIMLLASRSYRRKYNAS